MEYTMGSWYLLFAAGTLIYVWMSLLFRSRKRRRKDLGKAKKAKEGRRELAWKGKPWEARVDVAIGTIASWEPRAGSVTAGMDYWVKKTPDLVVYTWLDERGRVEKEVTYAEFVRDVKVRAAYLEQLGIQTGERVVLAYPPGLDFITMFWACLYQGVVAVPVYPPNPASLEKDCNRLVHLIKDSGSTCVFSTKMYIRAFKFAAFMSSMKGVKVAKEVTSMPWHSSTDVPRKITAASYRSPGVKRDMIAFLQYTSGSTSLPKGVRVTHGNLIGQSFVLARNCPHRVEPRHCIVCWVPQYHDMGLIGSFIYMPSVSGTHCVGLSPMSFLKKPSLWLYAISKYKAAITSAPNFAYELVARKVKDEEIEELDLSLCHSFLIAAEPIRLSSMENFIRRLGPCGARMECFLPAYGMAENVLMISGRGPELKEPKVVWVDQRVLESEGRAVLRPPGSEGAVAQPGSGVCTDELAGIPNACCMRAVDKATGAVLEDYIVGEIWVTGQSVASGYFGREEATRETFHNELKPGKTEYSRKVWCWAGVVGEGMSWMQEAEKFRGSRWLATGDAGFMVEGEVFITGRFKDLIIVRGRNVAPQDLEATVDVADGRIRPGCTAAFSVVVEDEEQVVMVAEVRDGSMKKHDLKLLAEKLRQKISVDHGIPLHGLSLLKPRTVCKTTSGKIQRHGNKRAWLSKELKELHRAIFDTSLSEEPLRKPESGMQEEILQVAKVVEEEGGSDGSGFTTFGRSERTAPTRESVYPSNAMPEKMEVGTPVRTTAEVRAWLQDQIGTLLGVDPADVEVNRPLMEMGLDSARAVALAGDLEGWLEVEVPATSVYEYPTIALLASHFVESEKGAKRVETDMKTYDEPVAIVGMACRFPGGANSPEEYWRVIRDGVDAIVPVPPDRWDAESFLDKDPDAPGRMVCGEGGFLTDVDVGGFDAGFFGIAPREAATMDPQHRLLLEVAWEALEDAGHAGSDLEGSSVGSFVGICTADYQTLQSRSLGLDSVDAYTGTGNAGSVASGRIAYHFGLTGPALSVDTACSSSLVAAHLASRSLRDGECDMALAGGVNLILTPDLNIGFSKARMLNPDGRCMAFDDAAQGYVRGEGCGMVVLKRLSDAERDGDHVWAILRGSAINQDGRSAGLTAPSGPAQQAVIRSALEAAQVAPHHVGYVEAHGTGTPLGDPIEARALSAVLGGGARQHPFFLGSAKTNLGHLEAAAGVAGLMRAALVLYHRMVPAHPTFTELNHHIDAQRAAFAVPTQTMPWEVNPNATYGRIAGISSFGFSGTNAHAILEEAVFDDDVVRKRKNLRCKDVAIVNASKGFDVERPVHILALSARTDGALRELAGRFANALLAFNKEGESRVYGPDMSDLIESPEWSLPDVCFSANVGRSMSGIHRVALVAGHMGEMRGALQSVAAGDQAVHRSSALRTAWIFTGQGSQSTGMGALLYKTHPVFRNALDQCALEAKKYLSKPLLDVMFKEEHVEDDELRTIDMTQWSQPCLFAVEWSLAQLWLSWGLEPSAVMGHSVGEFVAACVSGVLSMPEAMRVVCARGRLMGNVSRGGAMLAVGGNEDQVRKALDGLDNRVSISVYNGPEALVLSGSLEDIHAAAKALEGDGVATKSLRVSAAFHSTWMKPMLTEFAKVLETVEWQKQRIPLISNVTGRYAQGNEICSAEYWCQHVIQPVRFHQSVLTLCEGGMNAFLEVGPHPVLIRMARKFLPPASKGGPLLVSCLHRGRDEWRTMCSALGELFGRGANVDWAAFDAPFDRALCRLPTYPFQRRHMWLSGIDGPFVARDPVEENEVEVAQVGPVLGPPSGHPLLGWDAGNPTPAWEQLLDANGVMQAEQALDAVESYEESQASLDEDTLALAAAAVAVDPWIGDHKVLGDVVLPAAAYCEMGLGVWRQMDEHAMCYSVRELQFLRPLVFSAEYGCALRCVVDDQGMLGDRGFSVWSRRLDGDSARWVRHAVGTLDMRKKERNAGFNLGSEGLSALQERMISNGQVFKAKKIYALYQSAGLEYGEQFQGMDRVHVVQPKDGYHEILAHLSLAAGVMDGSGEFAVHPALLDVCFQVLGSGLLMKEAEAENKDVMVPVGCGRVIVEVDALRSAMEDDLWVHATSEETDDHGLIGHCTLLNSQGAALMHVDGLRTAPLMGGKRVEQSVAVSGGRADVAIASARTRDDIHVVETTWMQVERVTPNVEGGIWLVLADAPVKGRKGVGTLVGQRLENVVQVRPGKSFSYVQEGSDVRATVRPGSVNDFRELLRAAGNPSQVHVLHMWALDTPPCVSGPMWAMDAREMIKWDARNAGSLLSMVQALPTSSHAHITIVTRGALAIDTQDDAAPVRPSLAQSTLWGLARSLAIERRNWEVRAVDLCAVSREVDLATHVWSELGGEESEVVYRRGVRWVPRVRPVQVPTSLAMTSTTKQGGWELQALGEMGPSFVQASRAAERSREDPAPGEVVVEMRAWGLGARDALLTAQWEDHAARFPPPALGVCGAGIVVATGGGSTVRVGEEVCVYLGSGGALRSHVVCSHLSVTRKSPVLTFEEAAVAASAGACAVAALEDVAGARRGERMVVFAPAGGSTALAAVELGDHIGLDVHLVTLHRSSLRLPSSVHIHAADMDWKALCKAIGSVDIVLNMAGRPGRQLAMSWLTPYGRFVDLRQGASMDDADLVSRTADIQFLLCDIARLQLQRPTEFAALSLRASRLYGSSVLAPPRVEAWPLAAIPAAMDHVRRHSDAGGGAVECLAVLCAEDGTLAQPPRAPTSQSVLFRRNATYLLAGGLSDFGVHTVEWMMGLGARNFVLVGRDGVREKDAKHEAIRELLRTSERRGACVMVMAADVTIEAHVERIFRDIHAKTELPPVRGVFHLAAGFADALVEHMDGKRWKTAVRPKMLGAWNLHVTSLRVLPPGQLEHFVMFSSVSALLGRAGQANYAAANSFLDALALYRRASHLPGLAVQFGPIADVGVVARAAHVASALMDAEGLRGVDPTLALNMMGDALRWEEHGPVQLGVLAANLPQYGKTWPVLLQQPRLMSQWDWTIPSPWAREVETAFEPKPVVVTPTESNKVPEVDEKAPEELHTEAPRDGERLIDGIPVRDAVLAAIARIMGVDPNDIDPGENLLDMGMDSLMATSLRMWLKDVAKQDISPVRMMSGISVEELVEELGGALAEKEEEIPPSTPMAVAGEKWDAPTPGGTPGRPGETPVPNPPKNRVEAVRGTPASRLPRLRGTPAQSGKKRSIVGRTPSRLPRSIARRVDAGSPSKPAKEGFGETMQPTAPVVKEGELPGVGVLSRPDQWAKAGEWPAEEGGPGPWGKEEHGDARFLETLDHGAQQPRVPYSGHPPPEAKAVLGRFGEMLATLDRVKRMKANTMHQRVKEVLTPTRVLIEGSPELDEKDTEMLMLSSAGNYHGLIKDPRLLRAGLAAVRKFGTGNQGSRVLSGTTVHHHRLERDLSAFVGTDSALVYNSGFAANMGILPCLARPGDCIFTDTLNHASIIDAARLSGAEVVPVRHGDPAHLDSLLAERRAQAPDAGLFVIFDAVFSMEGDIAPLPEYDAFLIADEAHSLGVLGKTGRGIEEHFDMIGACNLKTASLGKSMGSCGGFVAGPKDTIRFMRYTSRTYVFSTSVSAFHCAAARAAVRIFQTEGVRMVARLKANAEAFRKAAEEEGFDTFESRSAVVPVRIGSTKRGDNESCIAMAKILMQQGYFAPAVLQPGVPSARLRIVISSANTPEELRAAAKHFGRVAKALGVLPYADGWKPSK